MATTSRDQRQLDGRTVTTWLSGECELHPIQVMNIPTDALLLHTDIDKPVIYWSAYIDWNLHLVVVTIGDYIMARWNFGGEITFTNDKGYGDKHYHTYITQFPTQIVDDINREFAPKL